MTIGGRRGETVYFVLPDLAEGDAWWRVTNWQDVGDKLVAHRLGPIFRVFTRCEPDGRIWRPPERHAVHVTEPSWGYCTELLVAQLGWAEMWTPEAA